MRVLQVAAFVLLLAAAGSVCGSSEAQASAVGVDFEDAALQAAAGGSPLTTNSSAAAGARPAAGQQQARPGRRPREEVLADLYAENVWKNDPILWILPDGLRAKLPHAAQSWLRCWLMGSAVYFGVGGLWVYYVYYAFGSKLFKPGTIPSLGDQVAQMKVAFKALPLYAALPTVTEWCAEKGWTQAFTRVSDVGLPAYVLYFCVYMLSVEFFVYWQHRLLHDIKLGYKWLHHTHHVYNKEHTLSPFAGLAFNPVDGILQALPYTWMLWLVPTHFLTHELMLFATGVWTTNIHDCLHADVAPIMGAGYHTIHHTTYKHNYGHYTTLFDWLFGTLVTPEEFEAQQAQQAQQAAAKAGTAKAQ